jgi:parallel beta-helix repeat protein
MGRPLYTNNAATYLAFGITNTATTMQVSANAGGLFPNPVGGDYFYVSLISLSGPIIEIVKCTARNGDIFTIERGQEGTSPLYWNTGDNVQLRITAAGMNFISGASATTTEEETQTATQGQTVFTLNTIDYTPNTNNLAVFVNGSKQVSGVNFTETSLNTVTFTSGLNAGDVVEFIYGLTIASGTLYATDIKYNEGGTGAVTRTLELRLQDCVSVKDFGALGDGTNDDTTAIQSALNSGALYVFVPQGTYKITSTLTIPTGVEFYGCDNSSVISLANNASMISTTGSNIVVRNMKLNGNSSTYNNAGNNAIYVNWTSIAGSNLKISNVSIINIAGAGIIALASSGTASTEMWIENCNIENTGAHGIIIQDYISNVWIIGNKVKYTGLLVSDRPGITASRNGSNVTVADNICIGSPSALGVSVHGISIDTTTNASVTGNNISGWIGYGIEIGLSTNCTVSANTITNVKNAGIALSANQSTSQVNNNITISGNTITAPNGPGIYSFITGGTGTLFNQNISVVGNTVNGSTTSSGIYMGLCNILSITGNSVYNNYLSGIYILDCKNVLTSANTVVNNNISTLLSVSSITQSSGTVTVTTSASHGYTTGNLITIMNAIPAEYNGTYTITVTGTNTFTYSDLPTTLQSPALALSGGILCTKPNSLSAGGVRPVYSVLTSKETLVFGHNTVMDNGFSDYYSPGYNGVIGFWNDGLYLRSTQTPYIENLTTGSNQKDRAALIMKDGEITIAYDNAGTLTYATLPLDGSTTSWTNSSTTP